MAIGVKKWAKVRTYYESGEFSVEDLHKKCRISARIINARIKKEKWKKGKLKPIIEKSIQEKYVAAFAKHNFDENRVAELIDKLGKGSEKAINNAITQHSKITGAYATEKIKLELPDVPSTLQVVVIDSGKRKKA